MVDIKGLIFSVIMAASGFIGINNLDKVGNFTIIVLSASMAFLFIGSALILISIFGIENMPTLFGGIRRDNREIIERLENIEKKIK